jgi:tetratricopeptide (TPR) repeat protein
LPIDDAYSVNDIDEARAALAHALSLFTGGKIKDAIAALKTLTARYPFYLSAHRLLAKIYLELGDKPNAYLHLAFAASGDPQDAFASVNLEAAAVEFGFLEHASSQFAALENSIARPEELAVHYFNKGKALYRQNDYRGAVEAFRKCLEANPKHTDAPIRTIDCLQAEGRFAEAFDLAQKLLASTKALSLELASVVCDFPDKALRRLAPQIAPRIDAIECKEMDARIARDFILAKLHHATGEHEKAWAAASAANAVKRETVRQEREKDAYWEKQILQWACSGKFPPSSGLPPTGAVPLFILGPSRSGKTTLESHLSKLDGVRRGFENKLLSSAVSKANNASGRLPSGFLPFLPDGLLPAFCQNYHRLFERKSADAKVFTTTTPGLIAYLPSILAALPNAKFVLMRRAPLDLLVRTYFKNYRSGHTHACDPNWILEYIDWYEQLSRQWEKNFPENVRTQSYEELVTDTGAQVRNAAAWLGLCADIDPSAFTAGDDRGVSAPYLPIIKKEGSLDPSRLKALQLEI